MNKANVVLLPAARRRYFEIWRYTAEKWGDDQADLYLQDLLKFLQGLSGNKKSYSKAGKKYDGLYKTKFKRHYIFFRVLSDGRIAVLTILHENMDIPTRLFEDTK